MEVIKMGSRETNGFVEVKNIHTGNLTQATLTVSKIGMEEKIVERKEEKLKNIELEKDQMYTLIKECANDLSVSRKVIVDNNETIFKLLSEFDERSLIFVFDKDINFVNKAFKLKEKDLGDFLSNFFFMNVDTYCYNLFGGTPTIIPMTSVENLSDKRVKITVH